MVVQYKIIAASFTHSMTIHNTPFEFQIDSHFDGIVRDIDQFHPQKVREIISKLRDKLILLNENSKFQQLENDIRYRMLTYLKKHEEENEQLMSELDHIQNINENTDDDNDDPDSWEYGYEGPYHLDDQTENDQETNSFDSTDGSESESLSSLDDSNFMYDEDMLSNKNEYRIDEQLHERTLGELIELCSGSEGLNWLIRTIIVDELFIVDRIIDLIDLKESSIDDVIAECILSFHLDMHDFDENEICSPNFLMKLIEQSLLSKSNTNHIIDKSKTRQSDENKTLIKYIKSEYAFLKGLENNPEFTERFVKPYNNAYNENNYPEMQLIWGHFYEFIKNRGTRQGEIPIIQRNNYSDIKPYLKFHPSNINSWIKYGRDTYCLNSSFADLRYYGREIKNTLLRYPMEGPNKNSTNIVVPEFLFVISSIGLEQNYRFIRIAMPSHGNKFLQSVDNPGKQKLIDRCRLDHKEAQELLNVSIDEIWNVNVPAGHSERVLLDDLSQAQTADSIVLALYNQLVNDSIGTVKVESICLLLYSTNAICERCTLALINNQKSYNNGFMRNLLNSLSRHSKFNFDQHNPPALNTFVVADQEYMNQPSSLRVIPKKTIYLTDPINLKSPFLTRTITEYISPACLPAPHKKYGGAYMSGSKIEKCPNLLGDTNGEDLNIDNLLHHTCNC